MMPSKKQPPTLSQPQGLLAGHGIKPEAGAPPPWLEAVRHPFRRGWWWLGVTFAIWLLLDVVQALVCGRGMTQNGAKGTIGCALVIIRCYMVTVETTLTNYGDKLWQSSTYDSDSEYQSFGEVLCVFVMALAPAAAWLWAAVQGKVAAEPLFTLLTASGCCYFCMGLIGVAFYGGVQGASPFVVLPALCKIGYPFFLASCAIALLPWVLRWALTLGEDSSSWFLLGFSIVVGFLLISHARLIAILYLDNRSRIGWE
ncbi:MAG: hypothetical protein JWO94_669 [Verrucomicrobiaceae bacterium]|nr:hypothetical protein [Verrucomicrobiaceae bacterium]